MKGHMPAEGMEDCHAALKTGGLWVTAMRSIYYDEGLDGYRAKIDKMVAEGKIKEVKQKRFMRGVPDYSADQTADHRMLYSAQESILLVYQRID